MAYSRQLMAKSSKTVGGGAKKVLYTLSTVARIGVAKSAKALTAKNTCKACGLGMGGQLGGMTNEAGEFPSVCNKSVQAQSTDIQPAIPEAIWQHTTDELAELSHREIEHLGRLTCPIVRCAGEDRFKPVSWADAMAAASAALGKASPQRTFYYASGRSSNEAGFLLQLLARASGTNNVNNCSFYCHQATSVGLDASIGTGTSTIELDDLSKSDMIVVIGANPASNHPRFIHQLQACRARGGEVVVVNPAKEPGLVRFAIPKHAKSLILGGDEIASLYLQPNIGEDIALLSAMARRVIDRNDHDTDWLERYADDVEETLVHLRQLDLEALVARSGVAIETIDEFAQRYGRASNVVFAWGMGITHHTHGSANVEAIANLALLRGMVGRPGAGLLPLRGHSNVQGIGTIGVKPVLATDVFDAIERELGLPLPTEPGLDTMACMNAAHAGEMDCAVLMGGNLLASNPNRPWAERALSRIGTRIALTTTLNHSHVCATDSTVIVLPVTPRDEEWEPTTQESMFNFVRLSDGGIDRFGHHQSDRDEGPRPETVVLAELAASTLPDCPLDLSAYANHSTARAAIAKTVPGLEALAEIDVAKREFHVRNRLLHRPDFQTDSGRARLTAVALPARTRDSASDRFNLTLASVRSEGQFNSIVYEDNDSYRGAPHRWCVLIGDADRRRFGVRQGDRVNLESADGAMEGVEVVAFDLPAGNLLAYYPEANALTSTAVDPRSKTPAFKSVRVRLNPVRA